MGSAGSGRGSQKRVIGTLLVEAGARGRRGTGGLEGRGERGRDRREEGGAESGELLQREDPVATQPQTEDERTRTNRSPRRECVGVMPRLQSKLTRVLHAHRGTKLLEDLQNQANNTSKRAMVRFRGTREKGAMAFVECLGVSQGDTMEGSLWKETLGRSLGSHDAAEPVGGTCHGSGCREDTTRLHAISCTKTGWISLTHNRVLHHALARSLRESKVQCVIEDTWPFHQRGAGQQIRHNPLRMDVTPEAGALFDSDPRHKDKALLLDLTIVNPCVSTNLENTARQAGKSPRRRSRAEEKLVSGLVPRYLRPFFLFPMSTSGEVGPDVHVLI